MCVKHNPDTSLHDSECVKKEHNASPELSIKQEPGDTFSSNTGLFGTQARTWTLYENGMDVIEILDSSDEEDSDKMDTFESAMKLPEANKGMSSSTLFNSGATSSFHDTDDSGSDSDSEMTSDIDKINSDYGFSDDEAGASILHTVWLDPTVSSTIKFGKFVITRQYTATALETVTGLPSYWPVPRDKRAYLLDLLDSKYDIYNKNGKLMAVNTIIKNNVCILHYFHSSSFNSLNLKGSRFLDGKLRRGPNDSKPHLPILGEGDGKGVLCRRLDIAGFHVQAFMPVGLFYLSS